MWVRLMDVIVRQLTVFVYNFIFIFQIIFFINRC